MKKIFSIITSTVTVISLANCSLVAPKTQNITVNATAPSVNISANGVNKGVTPLTFEAKRNESLQLVATKSGYKPSTYKVDRKLSDTAMLDIVGGLFLGLPFVGLLAPGAWELEQTSVQIPISR